MEHKAKVGVSELLNEEDEASLAGSNGLPQSADDSGWVSLPDGTHQGNETVWRSLVCEVHHSQLLRLVDMSPVALAEGIAEIRQQRAKQGKR